MTNVQMGLLRVGTAGDRFSVTLSLIIGHFFVIRISSFGFRMPSNAGRGSDFRLPAGPLPSNALPSGLPIRVVNAYTKTTGLVIRQRSNLLMF